MNNKQTNPRSKFAAPLRTLAAIPLCIATIQSASAYTLTFFPANAFSTDTAQMDSALGVSGYAIEDFEDTTLITGLSIGYTFPNNSTTTLTSLPQLLSDAAHWDGTHIAINDPAFNPPFNAVGYYAPLTTFNYAPGASSIGIGLSGFQSLNPPADEFPTTDHRLYVNGLATSQTLEQLAGAAWTGSRLGRNTYLRIDAAANESITSVGFEDIQYGDRTDDVLYFDHVAVSPAPEPSSYALLAFAGFLLSSRASWRKVSPR